MRSGREQDWPANTIAHGGYILMVAAIKNILIKTLLKSALQQNFYKALLLKACFKCG